MNVLSSGGQDRAFYEALWTSLKETGSWSGDMRNRRKNGEEFVERLTISTSYNEDGSVHSHIGLFADVTEARRREASIWRQAHYDHLTQLPNRQMFQQDLQRSMDSARASDLPLALVFLDLDYFKEVNDTFGHDMGDELLRQVARRLQSCVRSSDQVARLGGDEFTLILRDLKRLEDAPAICRKVLHAVAQPYELSGSTVPCLRQRRGDVLPAATATTASRCSSTPTLPCTPQGTGAQPVLRVRAHHGAGGGRIAACCCATCSRAWTRASSRCTTSRSWKCRSGRTVKAEALLRWNQPVRAWSARPTSSRWPRIGPDRALATG
ncbi:diguanylate cyclase [Alicycliphilus sp. B1]|nr:diguanylate cyclase [Alicycliphilus sp. B1]